MYSIKQELNNEHLVVSTVSGLYMCRLQKGQQIFFDDKFAYPYSVVLHKCINRTYTFWKLFIKQLHSVVI